MIEPKSSASALSIQPERPDQPEVIALIAALDTHAKSLYPPESNHLVDLERLGAPVVTFLVARMGGRAVGCGAILRDGRGWVEIKRMFVLSDERGRGIALRILRALEAAALSDRLSLARLETGIHNVEALSLYRRAGYRDIPPFGDYAPDPLSVFMEKRLDETHVSRSIATP